VVAALTFGCGSCEAWLRAGGGGPGTSDPNHPVVKSYLVATVVTPTWNPNISPSEPMWDLTLEPGNGQTVTVTAACCIGGRFLAKYGDETQPRIVGQPGDYVYPTELRVNRETRRVYGMARGLAGGIWHKTVIFEFDLVRRQQIGRVEVDDKILPPAVQPEGPKPRN
jgi:hypothetical protein